MPITTQKLSKNNRWPVRKLEDEPHGCWMHGRIFTPEPGFIKGASEEQAQPLNVTAFLNDTLLLFLSAH